MKNIFAQFAGATEKEAVLTTEPLKGSTIKYRELTMIESDDFSKKMVDGYDDEGKPKLDMDAYTEIKYEKAAMCLIDPKVTVKELKSFNNSFIKTLNEINNLIDGKDDEDEKEGNEES